ncbi:MAG: polysaccharide biosynthesis C-terminal domain-containing protein [candidate division FCPU426 bacterium]
MNPASSSKQFLAQFIRVSLFLLLNSASAFVINLLVARWVGPRVFGDFFFFVSTAVVATILFDFGLTRTLLRYGAFHQSRGELDRKLGYYSAILKLKTLLGVLVLAASVAASLIWGGTLRWELALGLVTGFLVSFGQFLSGVAQTEEDYASYNLVQSFNTLRLALILGAAVTGWLTSGSLYAIFLAAPLLLSVLPGIRLGRDLLQAKPVAEERFYSKIFAFGKWMILLSILETLHQRLDVILVRGMTDAQQAGYYSGALAFFGVVYMLPSFLAVLIYPRFVAAVGREDEAALALDYRLSTNVMTLVSAPLSLGLWAVGPDLVHLILGSQYQAAIPVFPILALYTLILGCHLNSGGLFMAKDQPHLIVVIVGCTLGANLLGNLLLIPALGIRGAAWSLCLATFLSLVLSWGLIRIRLQLWPSLKHVAGYVGLAAVMAVAVRFSPWLGWTGLAVKIALGAGIYLGGLWVLERWAGAGWWPVNLAMREET